MFPVHKNKCYEIVIDDIGRHGEGVGKVGSFVVYIPGSLIGDIVNVKIVKLKKRYAFGKVMSIIKPSSQRILPPCPIATQCGGCQIQALNYDAQCVLKEHHIKETLKRVGKLNVDYEPIVKMTDSFHYRNKAQFAFGKHGNNVILGLYAKGSHRVIHTETCAIQHPLINRILLENQLYFKLAFEDVYDEVTHTGVFRHLMIRASFHYERAIVVLVINQDKWLQALDWAEVMMKIPGVSGVFLNHNCQRGDTILGSEMTHLLGDTELMETIGELTFTLSPTAFFQVNPKQAFELYETISRLVHDANAQCLWDIYCGTGTIGLYLAKKVKCVVGIEESESAIANARKNAELNQITNCQFVLGKAEELMTNSFLDTLPDPHIVVLDPPRKGCDMKVLTQLLSRFPKQIIYVSCDVATFSRDAEILVKGGYVLKKVYPIDMFPHTLHVELVGHFVVS